MKRSFRNLAMLIGIMTVIGVFSVPPLQAQEPQNVDELMEELRKSAPRVFLDCRMCDRDYFREEITYVNYVRDRKDANVHVLVTDQGTGSGGREYTFAFIGLEEFAGIDNTLVYASGPSDTSDETRRGQVEVMGKGLFPYVLRTPCAAYITLNFRQRLEPTAVDDPWNFWVFSASADFRISGEETRSSRSLDFNFSANHVTPDIKIRLGVSAESDYRKYTYDEETYESRSNQKDFTGMLVKSISDHWSIGGWVEAESSTYSNLDSHFTIAPAIEFNLFPYAESTRRQLRFLYRVGWNRANYIEETIYEKMAETLFNESLTVSLDVREPWGSISASVEGSHYFHDFKKARFEMRGFISFRLFRGFSMNVNGSYEVIRDQLSLPVGDLTLDEILLRRKELATGYDYSFSIGLRYTFGSVFSNVVNPRFGGTRYRGGGGGGGFGR